MHQSLKVRLQRKIRTSKKVNRPKRRHKKEGPFRGKWVMESQKDPRWNAEGTSEIGGTDKPTEVKDKIAENTNKLGTPPDDLTWTYELK